MSAWAYRCHPCVEGKAAWFVSKLDVEQLGPDVRIVRVRVGGEWKCGLLDRTQPVVVEDQLLRSVITSDEADCPECAEMLAAATSTPIATVTGSAPSTGTAGDSSDRQPSSTHIETRKHAMKVQAAAIGSMRKSRDAEDSSMEKTAPHFYTAPTARSTSAAGVKLILA